MPTATGKGKIPHNQVAEYDPNMQAAPGQPREKHAKASTSKSMVGKTHRK